MYIKISSLSDGVHNFDFDENISQIGLQEPFFGNFKAEIVLNKMHHQIILDSTIKLNAHFECDRCDKEYDIQLSNRYMITYIFGNTPEGDLPENVVYLPFEADKIYVKNDLRDFALLAVPMKKLCSEDCKGLCPKCGKDLNEGNCDCENTGEMDSRWYPLMELKNKINKN